MKTKNEFHISLNGIEISDKERNELEKKLHAVALDFLSTKDNSQNFVAMRIGKDLKLKNPKIPINGIAYIPVDKLKNSLQFVNEANDFLNNDI